MNVESNSVFAINDADKIEVTTPWKSKIKELKKSIRSTMHTINGTARTLSNPEENLSLRELVDRFEHLSRIDNTPASQYLKTVVDKLPDLEVINCTLNRMLLKARVDLNKVDYQTESFGLQAINSLHLSGAGIIFEDRVSFEATIINDGIVFTGISGVKALVNVLHGTFRCPVNQINLEVRDGDCFLVLKTNNPMVESSKRLGVSMELEAQLTGDYCSLQDLHSIQSQERLAISRSPRRTYSSMSAFDEKPNYSLSLLITRVKETLVPKNLKVIVESFVEPGCLRKVFTAYAYATLVIAGYISVMSQLPYFISGAMILSAISLFLLSFEEQWTSKSSIAVVLNIVAMGILIAWFIPRV